MLLIFPCLFELLFLGTAVCFDVSFVHVNCDSKVHTHGTKSIVYCTVKARSIFTMVASILEVSVLTLEDRIDQLVLVEV